MKRIKLKVLRAAHDFSQVEIAKVLGVPRETYACIERGERNGSIKFWHNVQSILGVPNSEMWELIKDGQIEEDDDHAID